jgi:hypothetical protein
MPRPAEGKQASLQREIASVMAACGLRNIRYVAFPPVVFATPAPAATPEPQPEALPAEPLVAEAAPAAETVAIPVMAPLLAEELGAPVPAMAEALAPPVAVLPAPMPPAAPVAEALPPAAEAPVLPLPASHSAPRPGMRRLAELAAEMAEPRRPARVAPPPPLPAEAPPGVVPLRHYALLQDIAGELRPRRVRARAGKRA